MFQLYNANAADLRNNLWTLINSNGGDSSRMVIPANLIFPIEFATSSSGTGADSWGDAETPTTTANGHNTWLANTLCTFQALNISKYAYWAMYDPTTLWVNSPWYNYGQGLWWLGYWGLGWEYPGSGFKPAWNTLASFNQSPGSLYCPSTPAPNFNAWTLSDYLTVGQAPKIVWTASEMTSLTVDGSSVGGSWACDNLNYYPGVMYFDYTLGGSCAFTFGGWNNSPGYRTYSVVANNNGVTTPSYLTVNYGYAPLLIQVMGQNYYGQAVSVGLNQVFYIYGKGFALSRVNYLRWTRPGYADVYMYQGDVSGHYFYQDTFNIQTIVDPRIARGTWTVYAYNGQSVTPAVVSSVTVY